MANERGSNVDTPGASFTPDLSTQLPSLPQDQGQLGGAARLTGERLSAEFGGIGDELARAEGRRAGTIDGNDPNWRPTDVDTLRGQAYDAAAQDTYMNNLQVKTRYAINQAYQDYSLLPQDQKTPDKLQASLQSVHDDFQKNQVFPQIQGRFTDTFDKQSLPWLRRAQDDHDQFVGDQANASFLENQKSASDSAVRAASLGDQGNKLVDMEMQAHDRLVDERVNQGGITPEAGAKLKLALRQSVLEQHAIGNFMKAPDAQKGQYYEDFSKSYGTGGDYYHLVGQQESGGKNTGAGNGGGVYQFQASTWKGLMAQHPELDLTEDGRTDPEQSMRAMQAFTNDNQAALRAAGVPVTNANSYMAHFLGAGGAVSFLKAMAQDPTRSAASIDPRAAANNPTIFFENGDRSKPRSLAEVYDLQTQRFSDPTTGMSPQSFRYVQGQMEGTLRAIQGQQAGQDKADLAEIGAAQKQIVGGNDLPTSVYNDMQNRMGASTNPAVQDAMSQLATIRGYYSGFRGKTPQEVEASTAAATPDQQHGTMPGQVPIIHAMQEYLQKYRSDIATDPLRRSQHEGFIGNLTPIDFTKPEGVAAALALRAPQADEAAARFGTTAPMLLPDEKAQLKKLATAGGQPMIDAAQAIVAGLGPRAGEVFEQAAGDAPKFATAGRVALWGGAPGFLDDYAERQRLAQDPATNKGIELPAKTATAPIEDRVLGDTLSRIPALNAAVRQSARDVFEKRAMDNNYDRTLTASGAQDAYERTVQEAAGANFAADGTQYGGIGTRRTGYFSSQKVLAPLGMRADRVGDAMGALTDADLKGLPAPPVAGDGKTPVPAATIAGGQLTSIGHGVYQVSLGDPKGADPMWVRTPTGQKFTLDLNRLEPQLRQRVPGLYRTP